MSRPGWIAFLVSAAAAGGLYVVYGRPGLPDQPYGAREAEIERRDPTTLTQPEMLARLQKIARDRPADPQPHYFIGNLLKQQGRVDDAIRAYRSAIRRNGDHVPSLKGLADTITMRAGGEVSEAVAGVYERVWQLDPGEVRAGFFSGLPDWQAGNREAAEARWAEVRAGVPEGDPRRGMLDAFREAFTEAEADE